MQRLPTIFIINLSRARSMLAFDPPNEEMPALFFLEPRLAVFSFFLQDFSPGLSPPPWRSASATKPGMENGPFFSGSLLKTRVYVWKDLRQFGHVIQLPISDRSTSIAAIRVNVFPFAALALCRLTSQEVKLFQGVNDVALAALLTVLLAFIHCDLLQDFRWIDLFTNAVQLASIGWFRVSILDHCFLWDATITHSGWVIRSLGRLLESDIKSRINLNSN